jgi:hypothetical protein
MTTDTAVMTAGRFLEAAIGPSRTVRAEPMIGAAAHRRQPLPEEGAKVGEALSFGPQTPPAPDAAATEGASAEHIHHGGSGAGRGATTRARGWRHCPSCGRYTTAGLCPTCRDQLPPLEGP